MKETIKRLRAARKTILEVEDQLAEVDLRYAAEDIQTSIDELEKVRALTEALEPAFEAIQGAVRKAYETRDMFGSYSEVVRIETQGPTGERVGEAVRKAVAPHVRKARCTCGRVDVTSALTGGHVKHVRGLTDPQCPIHGKACTCGKVDVVSARKGYTTSSPGLADPQCPIHGQSGVVITDV